LFLPCLIEGEIRRTTPAANPTACGLTELVLNSKTVGRFTRRLDRLRAELEAATGSHPSNPDPLISSFRVAAGPASSSRPPEVARGPERSRE
jgi:hypothetical protein